MLTDVRIAEMIEENHRRKSRRALEYRYDPIKGIGCCGERQMSNKPALAGGRPWIPVTMKRDKEYGRVTTSEEWERLRCRHDFEYWAVRCVTIRDKESGRDISLRLNRPQRRVVAILEKMRLAGEPLRLIMLKARQWGGSTLVQVYMAWIQCCLRRNWNSLICAHVKDTAATIRGMYSKMLSGYPAELWDGDGAAEFRPFERSTNIRVISGRGCKVTIASAENQDAVRGMDVAMAHLSEVAFWRDTAMQNPDSFIRAICGGINSSPLTLIALESTANGVGNYFHSEWLRAEAGESDKCPVFVPWYEIDIYSRPISDYASVIRRMDKYEWQLWTIPEMTLEQIAWYQGKRREYRHRYQMMAEYPTTPQEAFQRLDNGVFSPEDIARMRDGCRPGVRGDIVSRHGAICGKRSLEGLRFVADERGLLEMWEEPRSDVGYMVSVDIGGRSDSADWSVIVVMTDESVPRVVAQWRGHIDHDLLAWLAARIATYYRDALLVFESNTLESEVIEGDPAEYILNQVAWHYANLYRREGGKIGFHTNRSTKTLAVNALYKALRDGEYLERSGGALDEMSCYLSLPSGGFAASPGNHDDMVMARAIALHLIGERVSSREGAVSAAEFICRDR